MPSTPHTYPVHCHYPNCLVTCLCVTPQVPSVQITLISSVISLVLTTFWLFGVGESLGSLVERCVPLLLLRGVTGAATSILYYQSIQVRQPAAPGECTGQHNNNNFNSYSPFGMYVTPQCSHHSIRLCWVFQVTAGVSGVPSNLEGWYGPHATLLWPCSTDWLHAAAS